MSLPNTDLADLSDEIMHKQTQNAQVVPLCWNKFMFSKQALSQNWLYLEIITTFVSQPRPQVYLLRTWNILIILGTQDLGDQDYDDSFLHLNFNSVSRT